METNLQSFVIYIRQLFDKKFLIWKFWGVLVYMSNLSHFVH